MCFHGQRLIESGKLARPQTETTADMFIMTSETLRSVGYKHYEVSNFARAGRESKHNTGYWKGEPYLGLGPSAHSFTGSIRRWNVSSVDVYISMISRGEKPVLDSEELDKEDILLEKIALGLRTSEGIPLSLICDNSDFIEDLIKNGIAKKEKNRFILLPEGMLLTDEIVVKLIQKRQ